MDSDKVKRTYYLKPDTLKTLNSFVTSYCANGSTGSTYGAHSNVVDTAINYYTANYTAEQSIGIPPSETITTKMKFKIMGDEQ